MNRSVRTLLFSVLLLSFVGCSAQATTKDDELERENAERLAEKEGIPSDQQRPRSRCDGVWDCTKTVFTDFVYLPVRVVRGMTGDVETYRQQRQAQASAEVDDTADDTNATKNDTEEAKDEE